LRPLRRTACTSSGGGATWAGPEPIGVRRFDVWNCAPRTLGPGLLGRLAGAVPDWRRQNPAGHLGLLRLADRSARGDLLRFRQLACGLARPRDDSSRRAVSPARRVRLPRRPIAEAVRDLREHKKWCSLV